MPVSALLDSGSEVNAIHPTFAWEQGLPIRTTDVGAQKIDGIMLNSFGMVVVAFSMTDKTNRVRFFEETFLVANISSEIVFGMPFLTLSGANVDFLGWKLRWRTDTTKKALPTTRLVELVGKKDFAAAMLDLEHETYIVHIRSVSSNVSPSSSPLDRPRISCLNALKAPIKVLAEYLDFADIFSPDLASELPEHTGINDHAIELVDSCQQSSYEPIYSLEPVELKTLKAYIETNLANGFIRLFKPSAGAPILFKSSAGAPVLFNHKSNCFLRLCVNY